MAERNSALLARLWWWLLPATGFFAYRDVTTRWERLRWCVPYGLWRVVNRLPVDPFLPPPWRPPCTCVDCVAGVSEDRP